MRLAKSVLKLWTPLKLHSIKTSYQDWQRNERTHWFSASMPIVSGFVLPKMRPTNHFGSIKWLKPVEPFANHHDYSGGEYEKTKTKIFMDVRAATVGMQELNINICVFIAPLEQKSWKIIRTIFVACRLRNISGSKSLRLSKRFKWISARKGTKKIRSIRLICVRPFLPNSPIMVRFVFKKQCVL